MLRRLKLQNYRGFERHCLELRPLTVLVGKNNAGKSTIVEALRLISVVTERLGGLHFRDPPPWSDLPLRLKGVRPSLEGLGIEFDSVCHRYSDPPASIAAVFCSGERVDFYTGPESEGFAVLYDRQGEHIRTKGQMMEVKFPALSILPQVGPLEVRETILSEDYVRRSMSSPLSPRHFRNQLRLLSGAYRDFRALAEETWPGLQVQTLEGARGDRGTELFLGIRDRDFVAEIARMGHGLQMWLQAMWFLSRTPTEASVVLDEPDVYMHPDLQRRLVRLVRHRFSQVLVATHSIEIMAEVAPSEVLIIDREKDESRFADSDPAVQGLIDRLGGIHNLQLTRLWSAKRCLFLEGKDLRYLKLVHDLLFPDAVLPLDDIPHSSIGGWGGWNYAIGSSIFIRNSVGEDISIYCVLDSDFHTQETVRRRLREAKRKNVHLHVWRRKEVENYFLVASAIARLIGAKGTKGDLPVSADLVRDKLSEFANDLRTETQDNYAEELFLEAKGGGTKAANRMARQLIDTAFSTPEGAIAAVSGKAMLGKLSPWAEGQFGASLGVPAIARVMNVDDVPQELRDVVESIHHDRELIPRAWKREWA